jgi:hypothetical protein
MPLPRSYSAACVPLADIKAIATAIVLHAFIVVHPFRLFFIKEPEMLPARTLRTDTQKSYRFPDRPSAPARRFFCAIIERPQGPPMFDKKPSATAESFEWKSRARSRMHRGSSLRYQYGQQ